MFSAMCECQALHPDPEDEDSDNDFEGEEYDVEEAGELKRTPDRHKPVETKYYFWFNTFTRRLGLIMWWKQGVFRVHVFCHFLS